MFSSFPTNGINRFYHTDMTVNIQYKDILNKEGNQKVRNLNVDLGNYQSLKVNEDRTVYFGNFRLLSCHQQGFDSSKGLTVMLDTCQDHVSYFSH